MRRRTRSYLFLMAGIFIFACSTCAPKDDEKALQELVEKAARLAEKHNISGVMGLTTQDFKAKPGNVDQRESKRILFITFRHYGNLKVLHPRPSVKIESGEDRALVSFPFLMVKKDHPLPDLKDLYDNPRGWVEKMSEKADLYHFRLKAVKVKGEWLVKEAYLEKITGRDFLEQEEAGMTRAFT
jgi:hypothetical protein